MARRLDCCGGEGGKHLGGCPVGDAEDKLRRSLKGGVSKPVSGKDSKGHKHNYQLTRRERTVVTDRGAGWPRRKRRIEVVMYFFECVAPGDCSKPQDIEVHEREL